MSSTTARRFGCSGTRRHQDHIDRRISVRFTGSNGRFSAQAQFHSRGFCTLAGSPAHLGKIFTVEYWYRWSICPRRNVHRRCRSLRRKPRSKISVSISLITMSSCQWLSICWQWEGKHHGLRTLNSICQTFMVNTEVQSGMRWKPWRKRMHKLLSNCHRCRIKL